MPIDRSMEGITTQQQIEKKILRVPADGFFQKPKARSNVIPYNSHNYYKSCKWKKEEGIIMRLLTSHNRLRFGKEVLLNEQ